MKVDESVSEGIEKMKAGLWDEMQQAINAREELLKKEMERKRAVEIHQLEEKMRKEYDEKLDKMLSTPTSSYPGSGKLRNRKFVKVPSPMLM